MISEDPLEEADKVPDWSKAAAQKPKITMKINFKPLPQVELSDSEDDLPPVLEVEFFVLTTF